MTTEELEVGIGDEEAVTLKPEKVEIIAVAIETVGEKQAKKLVVSCKHPAREELIKISSVKWENKKQLETSGLWYNLDTQKKIRKGSALANFLQHNGATTISNLAGKKVDTSTDDKGYLCFRAY